MKKILPTIILAACTLLTACKLDAPDLPPGATLTNKQETYQPITKGSTWRYSNESADSTSTTTITMTGKTSTFNGKTYYEATAVSGKEQSADIINFAQSNHLYYEYNDATVPDTPLEFAYLNDNEAAGYKWNSPLIDGGDLFSGNISCTTIEKGISKTVLGKTYKDVIHSRVAFNLTLLGTENLVTLDFYTAKGIGYIEIDTDDGTDKSTSRLVEYSIK
jgi:hypothetical protein